MDIINKDFTLTETFISKYKAEIPKFGYSGLGEFVYKRTYSRLLDDGTNEEWWQTVRRVVEGIYSIQKWWIDKHRLGWQPQKAQRSAQEMYDRMFNMKFLPAGRGLWAMGTDLVLKNGLSAALFNCNFISTKDIRTDFTAPFTYAMDMLMLGVGVGFDLLGAGEITIRKSDRATINFVVPDTREGWVESVRLLLESYVGGNPVTFDYTQIRKEGEPIKTFGGISSGYKPLEELHKGIRTTFEPLVGKSITKRAILDTFNMLGRCVISGNVRRSALLCLSDDTEDYINFKDYNKYPDRQAYGWSSNNSIVANTGYDYTKIVDGIVRNGEPGVVWLENMQKYSRMLDSEADWKDARVLGVNPCLTGDTRIMTERGEKTILDLLSMQKRPKLLVYNVDKNYNQYDSIDDVFLSRKDAEIYEVETEHTTFKATGDHLVFTKNGWVRVDALRAGINKVLYCSRPCCKKWIDIKTIRKLDKREDVYDISMAEEIHNFYANNILVHNCGEIALESAELCNLVEVFPMNNTDKEDFLRTLKFAYLYAKTITLLDTHQPETNKVILRNRRIGTSIGGVAQFLAKYGWDEARVWLTDGYNEIQKYDKVYSDWFAIPRSIKLTTIKPSGTISLLAGATPGIHFPISNYYIRRVRVANNSSLLEAIKKAGYPVEPVVGQEDTTSVIEFPISIGDNVRTLEQVSMWEQLSVAAFFQKYWSDNSVSVTITFDREKEGKDIATALQVFETQLKAVSLLPKDNTAYPQMPYEPITKEEYMKRIKHIKEIETVDLGRQTDISSEKYCTSDYCVV